MTSIVIDTSVVMCALLNEAGAQEALRVSEGASMSSVNVAEAVTKCLEKNISDHLALLYIQTSNITIVNFDLDQAALAGRLWKAAPKGKLSLGDRACIATAMKLGATVVTADRIWATLDLPCPVELIR